MPKMNWAPLSAAKRPASAQAATGGFSVTPSQMQAVTPAPSSARVTSSKAPLALAACFPVMMAQLLPKARNASACLTMQSVPVCRRVGMK